MATVGNSDLGRIVPRDLAGLERGEEVATTDLREGQILASPRSQRSQRGPTGRQMTCPKPTSVLLLFGQPCAVPSMAHIVLCSSLGSQLSRLIRVCSAVFVCDLPCHRSRLLRRWTEAISWQHMVRNRTMRVDADACINTVTLE